MAWNSLVEGDGEARKRWEHLATEGDALQRYRARMMLAMTAEGPLEDEVPELTRMVLEEIIVKDGGELTVRFLDGTERIVRV